LRPTRALAAAARGRPDPAARLELGLPSAASLYATAPASATARRASSNGHRRRRAGRRRSGV